MDMTNSIFDTFQECGASTLELCKTLDDALANAHTSAIQAEFTPKRILKSGAVTIVFWEDGTKTMVRCSENETPDDYDAFTAALAIKVFGSNSKLKRVIRNKTVIQKAKKGKA